MGSVRETTTCVKSTTRVECSKDILVWTIENFSEAHDDSSFELLSPIVNSNSSQKPKWGIKLKAGSKYGTRFYDFSLIMISVPMYFSPMLNVKLTLVHDSRTKILLSDNASLNFTKNSGREALVVAHAKLISVVQSEMRAWSSSGLSIECAVDYKMHNVCSIQINDEFIPQSPSDYREFYLSKRFSDFSLLVDGDLLPVHQVVLAAHSPVFAAMFETNMIEKDSQIVEIQNITLDIVKEMLYFMYTGNVRCLNMEKAMDMYAAADIYHIQRLKDDCTQYLKHNLDSVIGVDILRMADMHNDEALKKDIINYFIQRGA